MSFQVPTITVTGHGAVRVPRTSAVVRAAAVYRAPSLSAALAGGDSAREMLVSVARRHADARDVATQTLDVWPVHDDQGHATAFEARHSLSIRCPDPASAGSLIGALADAVGDRLRIDGVSIEPCVSDDVARTARELACADARARAEHLAGLSGLKLGAAVTIVELDGGLGAPHLARTEAKLAVGLEPGGASVDATVQVTFACTAASA